MKFSINTIIKFKDKLKFSIYEYIRKMWFDSIQYQYEKREEKIEIIVKPVENVVKQ